MEIRTDQGKHFGPDVSEELCRLLNIRETRKRLSILSSTERLKPAYTFIPNGVQTVSYTHLDVYKRQVYST